ncbi:MULTISPECIES: pitrilysin family protein [unclassified Duganella]|uniref:M16 family metallopeptidase n=1 Tax=unclassified Duganella TaxID=2636909 RepID=UPI00088771FB|nr:MULTISPECIES: M16 family metallopeptidase [unclassified Duganella]SDG44062.1 zinc protease [Duganella sp. OV458]SDJ59838.1 zinc protease [Duganella sp. OV510]
MTKRLNLTALIAGLLLAVGAAAAPALSDPVPINPNLKLGKLDNGLTYYIEKNAKPAQRVELRLVINAGSVLEDDDQRGMAHLLEHMAFNGSTHFKKHELIAYLQSIGVRFGADLNASTSPDATIYMLPIPTDKPGNLEQGMTVLEDWAHGLTLADKDIDDERQIVLQEKRQRSGYGMRNLEAMLPKLANGSRYKDRLPIGTEDSILHASPDAVRRFYADWYRPDLMAVIVVGDIDPADAEKLVKRHFAGLKMPAKPRPRPLYTPAPLSTPDALVFLDKEAPANTVQLYYSTFGRKPPETVGDLREALVRRLFGQLMSMRFSRMALVGEPPFIGGSAGEIAIPFGVNQYGFVAGAAVGKAGVNTAIDALVQENTRARQYGFSSYNLDIAKSNLLAAYEYAAKSRATRDSAAVAAPYIRHFLAGGVIAGADTEHAVARELVPSITLDEVNAYARTIIPATAPKLVLYSAHTNSVAADQAPLTGSELLARAEAAAKLPVTKIEDKAPPASLMSYKPEPGSIVAQSEDKALGVTKLTLSNGVKVMLKPTDFSKDRVRMLAVRPGGQYTFPEAEKATVRFASAVQNAMGVGSYSPSDLQRILAGKNVAFVTSLSPYADQLNGSSRSGDIESMLQLNYLAITNPRRDENLFRSFVTRGAETVRNRSAMPEMRFAEARLQTVYGNHPQLDLPPKPSDYESLNLDRSLNLVRSRLSSVKGMTFLFVGDFDIDALKPLLATYVATLPVGDVTLNYRDPGIRQVPGVVRSEVKAGLEQKSTVTFDFGGDVAYSNTDSWSLGLLSDVLNLRITDELREKQKLIYSGSASARYEKIPRGQYGVGITLPTSPQDVDKVEAALWSEIEQLQTQGPTAEDLNKVKQARLQAYRRLLRENGYWLNNLRMAALEDRDPHEILAIEQRINAVTAADIKAAAQRFLDRKNYVEMVLKPEE